MECFLPYFNIVTVPHKMVGLERMLDYRGVGLDLCVLCVNVYMPCIKFIMNHHTW